MDRIIEEFQKRYPTKQEKEEALKQMTDGQIDRLIAASGNIYGKIFYSSFKHAEKRSGGDDAEARPGLRTGLGPESGKER